MATSGTMRASPTPSASGLLVGLGLLGALVAFLAGRWVAESGAPAPATRAGVASVSSVAEAGPAAPDQAREARRGFSIRPAAAEPVAAGAPAPVVTTSGRATPELVARATAETASALEAARADLAARCWPKGGLASGQASATVTFNVTYDVNGREIARGVGGDRRSKAPEVLSCIQKLPLGSLRIAPTGANVGVRVAMNLP